MLACVLLFLFFYCACVFVSVFVLWKELVMILIEAHLYLRNIAMPKCARLLSRWNTTLLTHLDDWTITRPLNTHTHQAPKCPTSNPFTTAQFPPPLVNEIHPSFPDSIQVYTEYGKILLVQHLAFVRPRLTDRLAE